jgi:plasmid stabilization system protein ParE
VTKAKIALAANFERNLEAIGVFVAEAEGPPSVLDDLVDAIVSRLFPLLESHPRAGRDWMLNPPPTESGKALQQRIAQKLQVRRELREFVLDQHLVLYAIDGNTVTLLAIRHGRELGFDVR